MIEVTELRSKLELLVKLTPLGSRLNLAAQFGLTERALGYWEGDKPGMRPGIPERHYQAFVELLRRLMPGNISDADARRLLHGPSKELSAALLASTEGNWREFLSAHADATGLTLNEEHAGQRRTGADAALFGPAMLDEPLPPGLKILLPGERFQLAFETRFRTTAPYHVFILQAENGHWDALPLENGKRIVERTGKAVVAPNGSAGSASWYRLKENAQHFIEFVGVALQGALPEDLRAAIDQGNAIEGARLDRLAFFLGSRDSGSVRLVWTQRYVPVGGPHKE